jgi:hypothetical protein
MSEFKDRLQDLVKAEAKDSLWLFFLAFSRFEYTLKSAKFVETVRRRGGEKYLSIEWNRFAREHRHAFNPDSNPQLRSPTPRYCSLQTLLDSGQTEAETHLNIEMHGFQSLLGSSHTVILPSATANCRLSANFKPSWVRVKLLEPGAGNDYTIRFQTLLGSSQTLPKPSYLVLTLRYLHLKFLLNLS